MKSTIHAGPDMYQTCSHALHTHNVGLTVTNSNLLGVDLKDLEPGPHIWQGNVDLGVKPSRSNESPEERGRRYSYHYGQQSKYLTTS